MNYKPPTSRVFWVPVPDTGQSRMKLIDWKIDPDKKPQLMELFNPEKKQNYTVEILDYFGSYPIDNLPGFIARQIINAEATGYILSKFLKERLPEFKDCKKVLFYQVNPI